MSFLFICAGCGDECLSDTPEAEALDEMRQNFGDLPPEERALMCDDCFKEFMENLKAREGHA